MIDSHEIIIKKMVILAISIKNTAEEEVIQANQAQAQVQNLHPIPRTRPKIINPTNQ